VVAKSDGVICGIPLTKIKPTIYNKMAIVIKAEPQTNINRSQSIGFLRRADFIILAVIIVICLLLYFFGLKWRRAY
jgi:hypothetical protein